MDCWLDFRGEASASNLFLATSEVYTSLTSIVTCRPISHGLHKEESTASTSGKEDSDWSGRGS
jgi:hypothetical protein